MDQECGSDSQGPVQRGDQVWDRTRGTASKEEAVRKIGKTERNQVAGGSGIVTGREGIRGEVVESSLLRELAERDS